MSASGPLRASPAADRAEVLAAFRRRDPQAPLTREEIDAIAQHPAFSQALVGLARSALQVSEEIPTLKGAFLDAGRAIACLAAVYIHVEEPLTLPRLKDLCRSSGFLSTGRTRTLVHYLEHLKYLRLARPGSGRIPAVYAPTPLFLGAWRGAMAGSLGAAAPVFPWAAKARLTLGAEAGFRHFVRGYGDSFFSAANTRPADGAFSRVFLDRYAGPQLVWNLIEAGGWPPQREVVLTPQALSARFRVSAIHVSRLIADAEREELLVRGPGGGHLLAPLARARVRWLFAQELGRLAVGALVALESPAEEGGFPGEASPPSPEACPRLHLAV